MEFYSLILITNKNLLGHITVFISSLGHTVLQNGDSSIHPCYDIVLHSAWHNPGANIK